VDQEVLETHPQHHRHKEIMVVKQIMVHLHHFLMFVVEEEGQVLLDLMDLLVELVDLEQHQRFLAPQLHMLVVVAAEIMQVQAVLVVLVALAVAEMVVLAHHQEVELQELQTLVVAVAEEDIQAHLL
jgi:hypothetical protein